MSHPMRRGALAGAITLLLAVPLWAAEGHHGSGGIPSGIIYYVANFVILVGLLVYFLKKPAKEFFASRAKLIQTNLDQAKTLKDNAEKKYQEYERRLQHIGAESEKLVTTLREDGELERKKVVQLAEQQVAAMKTTTEKVLEQEMRKAKEELKREAVNLAAELAEKLLRENLTADDQNRLVGEYLKKMEKLA